MNIEIRVTMDIPAIAASPYAPAATFSKMVATLASPCRVSDGVPPPIISLMKASVGVKFL